MHYEKGNERIPVAPVRPTNAPDYRHHTDIRKTRLILLILLGIHLVRLNLSKSISNFLGYVFEVFAIYYFIQNCVDLANYNRHRSIKPDEKYSGSYAGALVACKTI